MGSPNCLITHIEAITGSSVVLLARVKKSDGTYLIQSDVTSIRVDLYELEDEFSQPQLTSTGTVTAPTVRTPVDQYGNAITTVPPTAYDTPAATSVVYNTLQTDTRWSVDSVGYNVAYKIATPLTDHIYEVRITFSVTNGDGLVLVWQIDSR